MITPPGMNTALVAKPLQYLLVARDQLCLRLLPVNTVYCYPDDATRGIRCSSVSSRLHAIALVSFVRLRLLPVVIALLLLIRPYPVYAGTSDAAAARSHCYHLLLSAQSSALLSVCPSRRRPNRANLTRNCASHTEFFPTLNATLLQSKSISSAV